MTTSAPIRKADAAKAWPKTFAPLSAEQREISDDFMKYWHEVLPQHYGIVDRFNHSYPVDHAPPRFVTTLEIGAGLGEHLEYEHLSEAQRGAYYALDIRENMLAELSLRHPKINAVVADCQQRLDFPDGYFDRILAIHVLEHLPALPSAVRELRRLTNAISGTLSVVIPCEGGLAYTLARKISAQRIFEKRYGQSYRWFIEREHINRPQEIFEELSPHFKIVHRSFFPLGIPAVAANLCIGLTLQPV